MTNKRITPAICITAAALLMWGGCPAQPLQAQSSQSAPEGRNIEMVQAAALSSGGVDQIITLERAVEVREFEGLTMAVDQYQINPGDSLVKVLQSRGLIKSSADQARMLRLIKDWNPDLKSVNTIMPGDIINVPSLLTPQQMEDARQQTSAEEPVGALVEASPPVQQSVAVKEYQRTASSQQPARVRILRNSPNDSGVLAQNNVFPGGQTVSDASPSYSPVRPAAEGSTPASTMTLAEAIVSPPVITLGDQPGANAAAPPVTATAQASSVQTTSSPSNSSSMADVTNYPSGNQGDLDKDSGSGVVYRTIKVRRGDTLERLLRREGMHRDLIYGHLLKVTLELNPEIKNPDLIIAGAEIRIPAAGDYLTAMAGVDPGEVRNAAAAVAERRRPKGGGAGGGVLRAKADSRSKPASPTTAKAAVAALPDETTESAKQTLALLFTRLGEQVDSRGQAVLRNDSGGGVELNTSEFPVVQVSNGVRLVLDPGSRLTQATIKNLRSVSPPVQIFRTGKKEDLDRALERLWALCGFYRVFNHERTYEGGGDIKLRIAADWMIWPTEEAWAAGQPLVVNRVRNLDRRTDPAWTGFLEDHGIKLVDLHKNLILPAPAAATAKAALPVVTLENKNPSLLAAELAKHLGAEAKVGVQLDQAQQPGQSAPASLTAPVLWETDKSKVVLEFGELPQEAIQTLKQRGYRVVSSQKDVDSVVKAVLDGFGLKDAENLTVTAPAGGPKMSLIIKGKVVSSSKGDFLITPAVLPSGLANLVEPGLTVLKY